MDHDERKKLFKNSSTPANVALERKTPTISQTKAMQSTKMRELRQALVDAGVLTLDQQAKSLGLGLSTTWAVLKGNHKCSGLSATLINRMLASRQLPKSARKIILEYMQEKSTGAYGHGKRGLRKFRARLVNGQKGIAWGRLAISAHVQDVAFRGAERWPMFDGGSSRPGRRVGRHSLKERRTKRSDPQIAFHESPLNAASAHRPVSAATDTALGTRAGVASK